VVTMPTDAAGWLELFQDEKRLYIVTLGGGAMAPVQMWEWHCPVCPYLRRSRSKSELTAQVNLHRCRARESLNWHPRYRMPPRWKR